MDRFEAAKVLLKQEEASKRLDLLRDTTALDQLNSEKSLFHSSPYLSLIKVCK